MLIISFIVLTADTVKVKHLILHLEPWENLSSWHRPQPFWSCITSRVTLDQNVMLTLTGQSPKQCKLFLRGNQRICPHMVSTWGTTFRQLKDKRIIDKTCGSGSCYISEARVVNNWRKLRVRKVSILMLLTLVIDTCNRVQIWLKEDCCLLLGLWRWRETQFSRETSYHQY